MSGRAGAIRYIFTGAITYSKDDLDFLTLCWILKVQMH